jgi:hypothetical protein
MATMEHVAILPDEISPAVVQPMLAALGKTAFMEALSAAREWHVEAKYTRSAGSTLPRSAEISASGSVELEILIAIFVVPLPDDSVYPGDETIPPAISNQAENGRPA